MNLFELSKLYEDTLAMAIDQDTGEILDDELVSRLDAIQEHRTEKLLNLSAWICDLDGEAEAIKGQIDRLKKRMQSVQNKADSLTKYLQSHLTEGEKLKDSRTEITWRKSSAVEVNLDIKDFASLNPDLVKTTIEPKKSEIKKAIQNGREVVGAEIVEKMGMVIK